MNSRSIISLVGLLALASVCCGDDDATSQSRATIVTSKAMDSIKKVANKGAATVEKAADGVTVKVERFVNPEPHQPGGSNLLVSAGRGVGRLFRNVTVEMARAAGSVGSGTVNLIKRTTGAAGEAMRQTANRVANPRVKGAYEVKVESVNGSSAPSAESSVEPAAASESDGQVAAELNKAA